MAKKGMRRFRLQHSKSRTIAVRLISMAMTGYYRTMVRPRTHRPLSMLKYDPVVKKKVLFLEATKGGRAK
ncbi:ribosomal protein L33 [Aspergillus fumigatus]